MNSNMKSGIKSVTKLKGFCMKSLKNKFKSEVYSQVWDQFWDQVGDQVWDQGMGQVRNQVWLRIERVLYEKFEK